MTQKNSKSLTYPLKLSTAWLSLISLILMTTSILFFPISLGTNSPSFAHSDNIVFFITDRIHSAPPIILMKNTTYFLLLYFVIDHQNWKKKKITQILLYLIFGGKIIVISIFVTAQEIYNNLFQSNLFINGCGFAYLLIGFYSLINLIMMIQILFTKIEHYQYLLVI